MPALAELYKNGRASDLVTPRIMRECLPAALLRAGDCPANGEFSVRHTTRNFPNREGSKPGEGQMSSVALMDARSIAATAANGGKLTAATDLDVEYTNPSTTTTLPCTRSASTTAGARLSRTQSCASARTSRTGLRCPL